MNHLTPGQLRAQLDGQLDPASQAHLTDCAECRSQLTEAEKRARRVTMRLNALTPGAHEIPPARYVLSQLRSREGKEGLTMLNRMFARRMRPVWVGVSLIAAIVLALSFAPVRAWAGQFLGLFRVQQVTVLPIDTTRLSALTGDEALGRRLGQLFSDSVTITKDPTEPQVAADAAEASQLAGFTVRLPNQPAATPQLTVQGGTAFEFILSRERAQALLDESGYNQLQLPASLDNALIQVDIPTGVTAAYGNCPKSENEAGSPGRRFASCVLFVQIPSPTINTPPDLDVNQLAEIGLQLTGMTAEQAHEYSQTVDWTSTLVVPIPRNGATYEKVAVDGVTGYLIQRPSDDAPQYALIWVKDGIIYTIGGLGNDASAALALANTLK